MIIEQGRIDWKNTVVQRDTDRHHGMLLFQLQVHDSNYISDKFKFVTNPELAVLFHYVLRSIILSSSQDDSLCGAVLNVFQ